GALRALVLNAPWLELQGSWLVRTLGQPVIERLAKYQPRAALPLRELGFYSRVLRGSAAEDAAADPEETGDAPPAPTPQELTDPAVTGWPIEWAWRTSPSAPFRPGWLAAVLAGHSQVAAGLRILPGARPGVAGLAARVALVGGDAAHGHRHRRR